MTRTTLLSSSVGVPLAILAMLLLFAIDARRARGVRASSLLIVAALVSTIAVLALVVVRFAEYA
jgi:hypothetical protein